MTFKTSKILFLGLGVLALGLLLGAVRAQEKPASPPKTKTNPKDGAEMVWIPAGEFLMGSTEKLSFAPERPQHKVTLDGYYIYKNLVTVKQYRQFCAETKHEMPEAPKWGWKDEHPIVNIIWADAQAYCDWASTQLPTEAQWEKAAKGTDNRRFPWGNDWDETRLQCSKNRMETAGSPAPVGKFPKGASPYGVLDMAGNVMQWCADWYDAAYYLKSPAKNPQGPDTGTERVIRGGSWNMYIPHYFRTTMRYRYDPEIGGKNGGFRCVVVPKKEASKGKMITTASGLQYEDIVVGNGATPKKGQMLTVHYVGTLTDGTKFDASKDHGQPFTFDLGGRVIEGWNEGLATMKVGGKRKLVIPPALGYRDQAMGPIPANSTLVFEVELLKIN